MANTNIKWQLEWWNFTKGAWYLAACYGPEVGIDVARDIFRHDMKQFRRSRLIDISGKRKKVVDSMKWDGGWKKDDSHLSAKPTVWDDWGAA